MVVSSRWLSLLCLISFAAATGCGDDEPSETTTTTTTGGDGDSAGDGDGDSGDGDGDGDGDMTPQSCLDAIGQNTTEYVENEVFERSCNFGSCHDSDNPAAGLELTVGNSLANLVDVASVSTGDVLVVPGDPSGSYLMVVIDHVSAMDDQGRPGRLEGDLPTQGTMPLAQPLLCQEKRDAVAAWISGLSM